MVKIVTHRTIVRDGWHNAFTDLCFWGGCYWLTFRRGSAHFSVDGGIVIMRSTDLKRWYEAAFIKTVGDDREPRFCTSEDDLHVYFGTFLPRPQGWPDERFGPLVTHVSTSRDGTRWSSPRQIYEQNACLWRVRFHNGEFYSAAYGWDNPSEKSMSFLDLLVSEDGLEWKKVARIAGVEDQPDEADILFNDSGQIWCIARSNRKPDHSLFYRSHIPYTSWTRTDLKMTIHCPVFCSNRNEAYLAGRRRSDDSWKPQVTPPGNTGIFSVSEDRVEPLLALPSDGDAAYPGLISQEPGRMIISYYSQHAYRSGVISESYVNSADIYLAELSLE